VTERTAATPDMGRRPPSPAGDGGERRCIVTGRSWPRARLVRFVIGPDGTIVPDLAEKLPGRGLWVAASADALAAATGRAFSRAARAAVRVPEDLGRRVEAGLAARCREALGIARRAGAVVSGFEKVRAALRAGKARLLIAAADGAPDGRAKVRMLAPGLPLATALTAAELGAALGREAVVHAAVTDAALAERIARECARLAGVRDREGAPDPGARQVQATEVKGRVDEA